MDNVIFATLAIIVCGGATGILFSHGSYISYRQEKKGLAFQSVAWLVFMIGVFVSCKLILG